MMEKYSLGGGLIAYVCRFYSDHLALTLSITHNGKHVAQSPYQLRNVFSDFCNCPYRTAEQWLSDFECPKSDPQIVADLEPFKLGINVSELSQRGAKEYEGWSYIHYSIIGNKVCQDCDPMVLETCRMLIKGIGLVYWITSPAQLGFSGGVSLRGGLPLSDCIICLLFPWSCFSVSLGVQVCVCTWAACHGIYTHCCVTLLVLLTHLQAPILSAS